MLTKEKIENLHAVYNIDLTGGFRAIHKVGMAKWYNKYGKQIQQEIKLFEAVEDILDGIEVIDVTIDDKKFSGHIEHGTKYSIKVQTLQTREKRPFEMEGYFIFIGSYDMTKFK